VSFKSARLILAIVPLIARSACGSAREQELEKQLAAARAEALEAAAAHKAAQRDAEAAKAQVRDAGLAEFYGSDESTAEETNEDEVADQAVADVVTSPEVAADGGAGADAPDA